MNIQVLHDINFYKNTGGYTEDIESQKMAYRDYNYFCENNKFMNIVNENVLNFRESSKIKFIANYINQIDKDRF